MPNTGIENVKTKNWLCREWQGKEKAFAILNSSLIRARNVQQWKKSHMIDQVIKMSNQVCFLSEIKKAKHSEKSGWFVELWKRLAHYNLHSVYWKFLPGRFRMQTLANYGIAVKNFLM